MLDEETNLVRIDLSLPTGTARTLIEYAAWVRQCADMTSDEATTATVDFALREVFRRDRLWRDERKVPDRKSAAGPLGPTTATAAALNQGTAATRRAAE